MQILKNKVRTSTEFDSVRIDLTIYNFVQCKDDTKANSKIYIQQRNA